MPNREITMGALRRTGHSANITWYAGQDRIVHAEVLCNDAVWRDGHTVRPDVPEFDVTVSVANREVGRFSHTPARRPPNGDSGRPELPAATVTDLVRQWLASRTDTPTPDR